MQNCISVFICISANMKKGKEESSGYILCLEEVHNPIIKKIFPLSARR